MKSGRCGNCGKFGYKKNTQAHSKAVEFELKFDKKCRVYKCPACPLFLITTQPKKGKI